MGNSSDPLDFLGIATGVARAWLRASIRAEELLLDMLRANDESSHPPTTAGVPAEVAPLDDSLSVKMRTLLARAMSQSTLNSRTELYHHILDQLVADEARIIGALSDGSFSPVVNVYDRARRGGSCRAVLVHASLIGRTANVSLPEAVPAYIGHLLALGLVEIGSEEQDLKDDYEILLAEPSVMSVIESVSRGPIPARVERLTISLSTLGDALWATTMRAAVL